MWFANQDFNYPNLAVKKFHSLPRIWQSYDKVRYLKDTYGDDCVFSKEETEVSPIKFVPEKEKGAKKPRRIRY